MTHPSPDKAHRHAQRVIVQPPPPDVRRGRAGVFGTFFVVGFLTAAWLVNIPAIQDRTRISHATLGLVLLILGVGGVIAMQVAGLLVDRLGSKRVTIAAVMCGLVAINLPALSTSAVTLAAALFTYGLANGAADVAMNAQAVTVERAYGRPIMSAFHAFWSVGGAAGAAWGAFCQALGFDVRLSVLGAALMAAVLAAGFLPRLLVRAPSQAPDPGESPEDAPPALPTRDVRLRVLAYGALAFLLMMAEGVAYDWAPLHAVEHLHQPHSAASLAYGTFAVSMTVGRLTVDRVAHHYGAPFVVRFGSLTAAVGIGVVILSGHYPVTLIGWAVFGLGLAGVVPQLFTAAGNLPSPRPSVSLARVVGAGYSGQLAGPALIGAAAGRVGLGPSFAIPLLFCVVGVALAGTVNRGRRPVPC